MMDYKYIIYNLTRRHDMCVHGSAWCRLNPADES